MSTHKIRSSVYFRFIDPRLEFEKAPAPERVGDLWARLRETFRAPPENAGSVQTSLLGKLGILPTDRHAHRELMPIIETLCLNEGIKITPTAKADESGLYFLSREGGEPFAVFKAGEKRAETETKVARALAHLTGFEESVIPGVVCSIAHPYFPKGDTIVELWNDHQKVYTHDEGGSYNDLVRDTHEGLDRVPTLTGIVEPFLPSSKPTAPDEFATMTAFAIMVGLRDGKEGGYFGGKLIDSEECMPPRLFPDSSPQRFPAATYLPLLQVELASKPIDHELLCRLSHRVSGLQPDRIASELRKGRIEFADLASEEASPRDCIFDHGGCYVVIEETRQIMESQPKHLDTQNAGSFSLLSEDQLAALTLRMTRLQSALSSAAQERRPFSSVDMVRAVDPLYDAHMKALKKRGHRLALPCVVGRVPLSAEGVELSPATHQQLQAGRSEERSLRRRLPDDGPQSDHPRARRFTSTEQARFPQRALNSC